MNIRPRGLRNKNPLNIRIGNEWLGEVDNPTDPYFEQFTSMVYGIRAGFIILKRYIQRYNRNTVRTIIRSWAPASENMTERYIDCVARLMNIDPDTPIEFSDRSTMVKLVDAMCYYECGRLIDRATIIDGYKLASQ